MILNRIHTHAYTLIADGNNGEEQLVISSSYGQSGTVALVVVHMAVDGGSQVLWNDRVHGDAVESVLRRVIRGWDEPNADHQDTQGNVDAIIAAFHTMNDIEREDTCDLDIDFSNLMPTQYSPLYQDFLRANAAHSVE